MFAMKSFLIAFFFYFPLTLIGQVNLDSIALKVGLQLEKSFNNHDASYFDSLLDVNQIINKFLLRDSSNEALVKLNEEIKELAAAALPKNIIKGLKEGDSYNFINYYTDVFNNYYLIFRLYGDEGVNYHEYHLLFDQNQQVKFGDVYIYLSGELLSETFSRIYYPSAQKTVHPGEKSKALETLVESYEKITKVSHLYKQGKRVSAWLLYNTIPEEIRKKKNFLIFEFQLIDPDISQKKYSEILHKLHALYPDDPSYYLLGIELFYLDGNISKAIDMVDALETITGDDFLNSYRGDLYVALEDYPNAIKAYEMLTDNYPFYEDGFDQLFLLYIKLENYQKAVDLLDTFIQNLGYTRKDLISWVETNYKTLAQSAEFITWKNKE